MMAPVEETNYQTVLGTVRTWPPELRLLLAEELLRTLHRVVKQERKRGVPAEQVLGIGGGSEPPANDEMVRRWIEEHRGEKYG
jgi:hypothetical protein